MPSTTVKMAELEGIPYRLASKNLYGGDPENVKNATAYDVMIMYALTNFDQEVQYEFYKLNQKSK